MENKEEVTAEVEIDLKEGKKVIEMLIQLPQQIEDCEDGKIIMLCLLNGETYTGFFKGMSDDEIMLGSLSGKNVIGLKLNWLEMYFEQKVKDSHI